MKKIPFFFIFLLILFFLLIFLVFRNTDINVNQNIVKIYGKGSSENSEITSFNVVTVFSQKDIVKGLSKTLSLDEDEGMYFIFEQSQKTGFWMKDMNYPLDIIFVNKDNVIVEIARNQKPCEKECPVYVPKAEYMYVLEINAGLTEKKDIKVGDSIDEYKN